jgi:putative peptidoglycan lipid II flippase
VTEIKKPARSLAGIAGIVAIATLISKVFGLVRQQAIAAAFGVGAAVDAYNYAYVIPGFLFVLLGGINGPFHSSIISVLAKRPKEEAEPLIETVTTVVGGLLLLVTIFLMVFADPLIQLIAPGTTPEVKAIAVEQFRIMAPLAVFSGLIGIGFGTLNAADHYWLPSVSPLFSSVTVIIGVWFFSDEYGAVVLAWGTLAGAILQWLVQIPTQWRSGMGTLRLRFNLKQPGLDEIWRLMGPATLSSGMLLISVYISLLFASQLPVGAASALGYAQLLFLTPLGILSNVILVPYMPIFSKLAAPENWGELKQRIRQSLVLTAFTMMPVGVYERQQFTQQDSQLVASVLLAYAVGMFFYLGRDVLVRVFYGLGDGNTPFKVSLWGLLLNAVFCFLFTQQFGAAGLALATVGVNLVSMAALLWVLNRRLRGLPWRETGLPISGLAAGSVLAGAVSWAALWGLQSLLGTEGLLIQLINLSVAGLAGLGVFALFATRLGLPEVDLFVNRLRQKFGRS